MMIHFLNITCYIEGDTVWEFKCVQELGLEHLLQLIVYASIIENGELETTTKLKLKFIEIVQQVAIRKYKLFNCRNAMGVQLRSG